MLAWKYEYCWSPFLGSTLVDDFDRNSKPLKDAMARKRKAQALSARKLPPGEGTKQRVPKGLSAHLIATVSAQVE